MKKILIPISMLFLIVLAGCAGKHSTPVSLEDNPSNHYLQGMALIEKDDWSSAERRFERALALEPTFAPAMAGKALILAHGAAGFSSQEHKYIETKAFRSMLSEGYSKAEDDTQRFIVVTTAIRAETEALSKSWCAKATQWYSKHNRLHNVATSKLIYYRSLTALDYVMSKAYFAAGDYLHAKEMLTHVIAENTARWHHPAGKLFAKVHKIERAIAHYTVTDLSRAIATKDEVSRADVAALLVNELKLDYLFTKRLSANVLPEPEYIPADIMEHPLKEEMLKVFSWHIRGLEPKYNKATNAPLFHPATAITRQELAFTLEDILIKITQDNSLATKFIGQRNSPFPDVQPTQASYNAIMTSVTRNLLENDLTGVFRPADKLDGAELLLAIVRLRNAIAN